MEMNGHLFLLKKQLMSKKKTDSFNNFPLTKYKYLHAYTVYTYINLG